MAHKSLTQCTTRYQEFFDHSEIGSDSVKLHEVFEKVDVSVDQQHSITKETACRSRELVPFLIKHCVAKTANLSSLDDLPIYMQNGDDRVNSVAATAARAM
jgi:hypothetical protein